MSLDTLPESALPMMIKKLQYELSWHWLIFEEKLRSLCLGGLLADSCHNLISKNLEDQIMRVLTN